jgi:uncharacterized protein YbjT (DUF2867 family)
MNKGKDIILVTGATGQQGGALANELLNVGHTVRAMTRNTESEKARSLAARGAQVVSGNLDDPDSLRSALDGAWGVFGVQNTWEAGVEGEEEQGKRLVAIAKEVGVQHFVYASVGSAHENTGIPHFDNKYRVEETLRASGIPSYAILRPVFFMENLASPWFKPGIDEGTLAAGIRPDTSLQMIAVSDIGRFAIQLFERHAEFNGRAVDVAGSSHTMPEVAALLSSLSGRTISHYQVPIDEIRQWSEDFALMLEWFDAVGYSVDVDALESEFGFRPIGFQAWARQVDWN